MTAKDRPPKQKSYTSEEAAIVAPPAASIYNFRGLRQPKGTVLSCGSWGYNEGMLNLEHRHAFGSSGDLLESYNGPRPCPPQHALLFALQQSLRRERAGALSGTGLAATGDSLSEVDGILQAFEVHLHQCQDCGNYNLDPSLAD